MSPEIRFNAFGIPYLIEFANVTFRSRSRQSLSRPHSRSVTLANGSVSGLGTGSVSDESTVHPVHSNAFRSVLAGLYKEKVAQLASSESMHKSKRSLGFPLRRSPSRLRRAPSTSTCDSDWTLATASSETLSGSRMSKLNLMKSLPPEPKIELESEIECEGKGLLIRFASQTQLPGYPRKLSEHRIARLKYRIAKAVMAAGMDSSPAAELGNPMDYYAGDYRASFSSIRSEEVVHRGLPSSLFRGTYGQVMTALKVAGLATEPCQESGVEDATLLGALFVAHQKACGGIEFTRLTLWA